MGFGNKGKTTLAGYSFPVYFGALSSMSQLDRLMRLYPRRKRAYLLALVSVVIVGTAAIWWAVYSKSDFERRVDQIKLGMIVHEIQVVMESDQLAQMTSVTAHSFESLQSYRAVVWDEAGEQVALDFDHGRLSAKYFTRLPTVARLRLYWLKIFRSGPPC
jgi:hypothetical protein